MSSIKTAAKPVIVIIPSRFSSQRLPAKPLVPIRGRLLIERVLHQCKLAEGIREVYVATDHREIAMAVEGFGGNVVMTDPDCPSGTDRVAEAAKKLSYTNPIVINVQGDEPLIEPSVITRLAEVMLADTSIEIATPISRIRHFTDLINPNVVKVVRTAAENTKSGNAGSSGDALYFSRQPIPYIRDLGDEDIETWLEVFPYYKHIGVYAYQMDQLQKFSKLAVGKLEAAERLEQLRFLEAGIRIRCVEVEYDSIAVDVAEDVIAVERILDARQEGGVK